MILLILNHKNQHTFLALLQCAKNNDLNHCIKTKPFTTGADTTVYVRVCMLNITVKERIEHIFERIYIKHIGILLGYQHKVSDPSA